jgi:hypothetical protein
MHFNFNLMAYNDDTGHKSYEFFWKKFYIPSIWCKDPRFSDFNEKLLNGAYKDKIKGFETFEKIIREKISYDNDRWISELLMGNYTHSFAKI